MIPPFILIQNLCEHGATLSEAWTDAFNAMLFDHLTDPETQVTEEDIDLMISTQVNATKALTKALSLLTKLK